MGRSRLLRKAFKSVCNFIVNLFISSPNHAVRNNTYSLNVVIYIILIYMYIAAQLHSITRSMKLQNHCVQS